MAHCSKIFNSAIQLKMLAIIEFFLLPLSYPPYGLVERDKKVMPEKKDKDKK